MIVFPNCKINLGLHIINKREDGYHNLESVFYPLPLYDVLEVIHSTNMDSNFELVLSGIKIDAEPGKNLCIQAYNILKKDFPQLPPVKIYLHKTIPLGAGLGGGSADAASMLLLLNKQFHLALSEDQLFAYALELGSDCPFFILNKPAFATQRGEVLEPVRLDLSSYKLILVNPGIHIDTSWAFSQVKHLQQAEKFKDIIAQSPAFWKQSLKNDFEQPVFLAYPEIKAIKKTLYDKGAIYAGMSGSGSSVYGIFNKPTLIISTMFPGKYFVKEFSL